MHENDYISPQTFEYGIIYKHMQPNETHIINMKGKNFILKVFTIIMVLMLLIYNVCGEYIYIISFRGNNIQQLCFRKRAYITSVVSKKSLQSSLV